MFICCFFHHCFDDGGYYNRFVLLYIFHSRVEKIGLDRLDEYGLWIQVIDESGQEIFSYNKPESYPTSYPASTLLSFGTSAYENENTVFVS